MQSTVLPLITYIILDPCSNVEWSTRSAAAGGIPLNGPATKVIIEATQSNDADFNFLVAYRSTETAVVRGWDSSYSADPKSAGTIKIGLGSSQPILPRTWARVVNVVQCGIQQGKIAKDYQLVVDKEPCQQSLSARFQAVISLVASDSEPAPKLAC